MGIGQEGERGEGQLCIGVRIKLYNNAIRNKTRNHTSQTHYGDDSAATDEDWTYPPSRANIYSRNSKLDTLQLLIAKVCIPVGMQANMKSN